MLNKMISIFTPTYNRAELLPKLKKSLDQQTCTDFEWIIVDDGSSDSTMELLDSWEKESHPYNLIVDKQKNQGKHIAFNHGVKLTSSKWFICVDSDDLLTKEAVKIMTEDIEKVSDANVGIVYPRIQKEFNVEKQWSKIDGRDIDIVDLKELYGIPESAILMRTKIIKDLPFPKFKNEKFLPESWLYQKLANLGKFHVRNTPFYTSEYQLAGLTANVWKLWYNNPVGVLDVLTKKYAQFEEYPFKNKITAKAKVLINIDALCIATNRSILEVVPSKIWGVFLMIPAIFFSKQRFSKLKKL